ncbi:protein ABIL2-like [Andrographis paniculata]|uniref:protein ABIL2-like n=1 Tax=Andrographis paniculata TaxID=175694 RepID=UPI0021E9A111|nr:protein ABIL2-like [Andrographis paniculata]
MAIDAETAATSYSSNTQPLYNSNCDEIFMHHRLQFSNNLKDLKNLRQQLYSAAEYFETSYNKDDNDRKHIAFESSKEYVCKALVSTVDHLGSVADKLNKFLDQKTEEFSSTNTRFYCIEKRLNAFYGFVDSRGISRHSLFPEAPEHHKQYNLPGARNSYFKKLNLVYKDCIPCDENETNPSKQDNPFAKAFQVSVAMPQPPLLRKQNIKSFSSELPMKQVSHAFARILSTKDTAKSSVSPHSFALKRSSSAAFRSASPDSSIKRNQVHTPSESGRSIMSARVIPETTTTMNKEKQIISYSQRSKNFLKALLSIHHSRRSSR